MHIGILTQALHGNYGGILQNYALQKVLIKLGHTPCTIDRHFYRPDSPVKNIAKWFARHLKPQYESGLLTARQRNKLVEEQMRFVHDNIKRVGPLFTQEDFDNEVRIGNYDAFIVGSDQCWRPLYSSNILNYFLDFCSNGKTKKLAYAASFGTDTWEYSSEMTAKVTELIGNFDAVSVREQSGVALCKDYLGTYAEWVLDPTMLLGAEGFRKFIANEGGCGITTYLLEDSSDNQVLLETVKNLTGESKVTNNLSSPIFRRWDNLKSHKNISVEAWLSNIANSKFVITDSFHGVVFSILFNVPFIVKFNGIRGNTRIESLLTDFGLENCLYKKNTLRELPVIDWDKVNRHLAFRRNESVDFLTKALR